MKKALTILLVALSCNLNKSFSQPMHDLALLHALPVDSILINDGAGAIALAIVDSIYASGLQSFNAYAVRPLAVRSIVDEGYLFIPYSLEHLVDSINEKKIVQDLYVSPGNGK